MTVMKLDMDGWTIGGRCNAEGWNASLSLFYGYPCTKVMRFGPAVPNDMNGGTGWYGLAHME